MAKKNVTIKFGAETKDAEAGINKITSSLNKLAKDVKKNPITKLSQSVTMLGGAFHVATGLINKVSGAINGLTDASQKQVGAEKLLEAAAKNNPYVSDYSVAQLKKYASELQSISTIGDEELLPMMAQLLDAGRNQAEIQDIMAAALDMSTDGVMSLETAVKQLNATYSGSAGKLGQLSGAVKGLNAEQLKNGEAVRLLKEQYSGIAKTVSDSTGGWQKFKNTFGDFKEILGSSFAQLQNSAGKVLNNFFGTVIEKLQSAGKEADEFKKKLHITETLKNEKASVADLEGVVNQLTEDLEEMEKVQKAANSNQREWTKALKEEWREAESTYKKHLTDLRNVENQLKINKDALESQRQAELLNSSGIEETTQIYSKYADSIADATAAYKEAKFTADEYADSEIKNVSELEKKYKNANSEFLRLNNSFQNGWNGSSNRLQRDIDSVTKQLQSAQVQLAEARRKAEVGRNSEADEKAKEIIKENTKELQKNIAAIEQKYTLMEKEGQKIDEVAKSQEILSAQESAYLKLISENTSLVTQNNAVAKARLAEIKKSYEQVTEAIKKKAEAEKDKKALTELKIETEKLAEEAKKFIGEFSEQKLSEQISAVIQKLEEMKGAVAQGSNEWEYYTSRILNLSGLLDEVLKKEKEIAATNNETEVQKWARMHEQKFEIASEFAGKYAEIMQGISDLVTQNAEKELAVKKAALEEQLENGEISQEEYEDKMEQIQKESAEKQYKIQMWEWGANLLNIQAQTALAVVKALAEGGPYAGPAMAALIGILGGVQLATAIANKPTPPNFASGGVIGGFQGASMGEDNTYIHARAGEMILNAKQQKAMWNQLNAGTGGGTAVNMNVKVINNASNEVRSNAQMSSEGLVVTIDKIVNSSMQQGKYTNSMNIAQSQSQGVKYL